MPRAPRSRVWLKLDHRALSYLANGLLAPNLGPVMDQGEASSVPCMCSNSRCRCRSCSRSRCCSHSRCCFTLQIVQSSLRIVSEWNRLYFTFRSSSQPIQKFRRFVHRRSIYAVNRMPFNICDGHDYIHV